MIYALLLALCLGLAIRNRQLKRERDDMALTLDRWVTREELPEQHPLRLH